MDRENEGQQSLPWDLTDDLGTVYHTEAECPGVWYVSAENENSPVANEYCLVELQGDVISEAAKAYGQPLPHHPDLLVYSLQNPKSGAAVVGYEIKRYRIRNNLPSEEGDTLLGLAAFARGDFPEYFGKNPAPLLTSRGYMTRYRELMDGVFFIETDCCETVLALCYPIWKCDISEYCRNRSEQTVFDREHGIDTTHGYVFFPLKDACLPVFELVCDHWELRDSNLLDIPALMNAIWTHHPDYAAMWNREEQSGLHDLVGELYRSFGVEIKTDNSPGRLISFNLSTGTSWLRF